MLKPIRSSLALAASLALALVGGRADAGGISVANNGDANALVNALLAGGTGGITVDNVSLSNQSSGSAMSTGIYSTNGPNNYNLQGSGIVISSGNAGAVGSGPVVPSLSTNYGTDATAAQTTLLQPLSPASSTFHDVTELTITFSVDANTTSVNFGVVFASAEYPHFVGSFNDAFGLFLNGQNIAFTGGGDPVNINNPLMVNTYYSSDPLGVNGDAYQETALQGLLVGAAGNPFINFGGSVVAGSTGNTLTFIIADANDGNLDTVAYISGLGNAPPPGTVPEPASMALLGLGVSALALFNRYRRSSK